MWTYQGKEIESIADIPIGTFGFIYEVTNLKTGSKYLGKKVLEFNKTLPPLKGTKKKRKVVKESDWKTYYGSHPEFKKIVKEGRQDELKREILSFVPTKKLLTYYETKFLFEKGVLEPDSIYINDNISGKFYKKDFINA